jgi:hypothetical protein
MVRRSIPASQHTSLTKVIAAPNVFQPLVAAIICFPYRA